MLCEVRSLGLSGISGYEVRAECDLSAGLPAFEIVGLPDAAVKEARDRVRAAIKNCGFTTLFGLLFFLLVKFLLGHRGLWILFLTFGLLA